MRNPARVPCRVSRIVDCGHQVYRVDLDPLGRVPRFSPGQFLHLTLDPFDPSEGYWPESRVFSIASRSGAGRLTIVYSVKGRYTSRMETELRPGRDLWVKLPFGDFSVGSRVKEQADIVLIAGGTGVSPFVPLLEEMREIGAASRRTMLFYGVRFPQHVLFGDLLFGCQHSGLVDVRLSVESPSTDRESGLAVSSGSLKPSDVLEACRNLADPVFFISGPPAMIDAFRRDFGSRGVRPTQIQVDEWE